MEATTTMLRNEQTKHTGELADLTNSSRAIGNAIALQAVTLARIEEGLKGVNARFDDLKSLPAPQASIKASATSTPAPPPHHRTKAAKKESGGLTFLSGR